MAVVTFGGAYAVLAYVAQEAVQTYGWVKPGEMLDGLGMAETTPGPLIIVTQFVGFMGAFRNAHGVSPLAAGILGGALTTWVTFTPCFLWIFLGAPFVEALRGAKALNAGLAAIGAAVVGVILNLALWFALHVLFRQMLEVRPLGLSVELPVLSTVNVASALLTLAAAIAAFRFKVGMIPLLARPLVLAERLAPGGALKTRRSWSFGPVRPASQLQAETGPDPDRRRIEDGGQNAAADERRPETNPAVQQPGHEQEHRQRGQHEPEGPRGVRGHPHRIAGVAPQPDHPEHRDERQRRDQAAETRPALGDFGDGRHDPAGDQRLQGHVEHRLNPRCGFHDARPRGRRPHLPLPALSLQ